MLTSVIISVLGGSLLILFAFVLKKNASLSVILASIGVVLLIYGGFSYGSLNPLPINETFDTGSKLQVEFPINEVQVISPVDGDVVNCRILSMGVYPESHDKDIWVLLRPSDKKFYPQSDWTNTSYKENGKWQVVTRFGGDEGEAFDLFVFETDASASLFFSETIAQWKEANAYEGLTKDQLPSGANEIDRIQVTLKNSCRGIH